jgi:hypothetical protein
MVEEKRLRERIPVKMEVYWERPTGTQLVQITNLSLSGCFVKTLAQPAIGTLTHLDLRFPSGEWHSLDCILIRCEPGHGFGVRFAVELDEDVFRSISRIR